MATTEKRSTASRRQFLYSTALSAALATLGACTQSSSQRETAGQETRSSAARKGSATKPLPTPKRYFDAPSLSKAVKAGRLPPVEDRLPERPYVVPHNWLEPGEYGGNLRLIIPSTQDAQMLEYMYGHSPLRWLNDALDIGPGLVESWESNDDTSEWTFHFRKGLRWSDGNSWTVADVMFWWEEHGPQ